MPNHHRAGRIPIHPEAFSHDLGLKRKRPRLERDGHLKFIRGLPCLICGARKDIQAAHIRMASPVYGKRHIGAAEKSSDHWTLPLCQAHHALQHQGNELAFWQDYGIDPFKVALSLFASSGDDETAELILKMARR